MTEISPLDLLPKIEIAQARERYSIHKGYSDENYLMEEIKSRKMLPFYRNLISSFQWPQDNSLISQLEQENNEELSKLQSTLAEAKENGSEEDVRMSNQNLALFFLRIGDKSNSLLHLKSLFDATVSLGQKIDVVFCQIRLAFFFKSLEGVSDLIDSAKSLVKEGGDWERKNRLTVYEGLYLCSKRNFTLAAANFIQSLSTFTAVELLSFDDFVYRTTTLACLTLPRAEFRSKIEKAMEVRSAPEKTQKMLSLFKLQYDNFFDALSELQSDLESDIWFGPHILYLIKELRVRAYRQFLQPFQTVQMENMSKTFGVSVEFVEKEMRRFIFAKKIDAKIDRVNRNIITNPPDSRAALMREALKKGEAMVIRLQKLSRILSS